VLSVESIGD
jgi:hypothetical protein